jgi:PEP-CTERM motif-containing protein
MQRCLPALVFLTFVSLSTGALNAQVTIVQRSGPQTSDYVIEDHQVLGVTWTQNSAFTGVSIFATISLGPDNGFAYLTNRIGPGTTAANEIASTPFVFPATTTETPLFAGLTLGAGTYYLTLTAASGRSAGWWGTNTQTVTSASGVTLDSDYDTFTPSSYPPATAFFRGTGTNLLFRVTGIAVPEPTTVATFGLGIAALFGLRFKRRP